MASIDNVWTMAEENMASAGFTSGIAVQHIAQCLNKTPGSVRQKLKSMGFADAFTSHPRAIQVHYDESILNRMQDRAFQRAMVEAIEAGLEKAPIGIAAVPDTDFWPRQYRGIEPASYCGSPASLCEQVG